MKFAACGLILVLLWLPYFVEGGEVKVSYTECDVVSREIVKKGEDIEAVNTILKIWSKKDLLYYRELVREENEKILFRVNKNTRLNAKVTFSRGLSIKELDEIITKGGIDINMVRFRSYPSGGGEMPYYVLKGKTSEFVNLEKQKIKEKGEYFRLVDSVVAITGCWLKPEAIEIVQKDERIFIVDLGPSERYLGKEAASGVKQISSRWKDVAYYVEKFIEKNQAQKKMKTEKKVLRKSNASSFSSSYFKGPSIRNVNTSATKTLPTSTTWIPDIQAPSLTNYTIEFWDGEREDYEAYIYITLHFGWGPQGLQEMQNKAASGGWRYFIVELNRWPRESDPEDWDGTWYRLGGDCWYNSLPNCKTLDRQWLYLTDIPNPGNDGLEEHDSWFYTPNQPCWPWCESYNVAYYFDRCCDYETCDEEYEVSGVAADFQASHWYNLTYMLRIDQNPTQLCQEWYLNFGIENSSIDRCSGADCNTEVDRHKFANQDPFGDIDNDGLSNNRECDLGTDMNNSDTDSDGMSDGWEVTNALNPLANDANDDPDNDCWTNLHEHNCNYHPRNASSPGWWKPCLNGSCIR